MFRTHDAGLRPPFMCIICRGGEDLIDTLRELDAYANFELNGTMYLCAKCAAEAADTLGFVSGDIYTAAINELDAVSIENEILREKHLENVDAVIEAVKSRLPKPRATKPKIEYQTVKPPEA